MKRDDADEVDLDKAEVILKSALVTDDQSSSEDEEDTEPQLAPVAVAELQQEQLLSTLVYGFCGIRIVIT